MKNIFSFATLLSEFHLHPGIQSAILSFVQKCHKVLQLLSRTSVSLPPLVKPRNNQGILCRGTLFSQLAVSGLVGMKSTVTSRLGCGSKPLHLSHRDLRAITIRKLPTAGSDRTEVTVVHPLHRLLSYTTSEDHWQGDVPVLHLFQEPLRLSFRGPVVWFPLQTSVLQCRGSLPAPSCGLSGLRSATQSARSLSGGKPLPAQKVLRLRAGLHLNVLLRVSPYTVKCRRTLDMIIITGATRLRRPRRHDRENQWSRFRLLSDNTVTTGQHRPRLPQGPSHPRTGTAMVLPQTKGQIRPSRRS